MNFRPFFIVILLVNTCVFAQTNSDRSIAEKFFQSEVKTTMDSTIIQTALFFLNTPYVAGTLERTEQEELVVNLHELDCTTLVENCLALSRTMHLPSPDYETFIQELRKIRYRSGRIDGYVSRLHYTTDWIYDNVGKGIIEDMTYALGGRKLKPDVYYMSENYEKYPHLADDSVAVQQIRLVEKAINARSSYHYIPKKEITQCLSLIKNGDIICFTTNIPGLDVSHLSIAYWDKRRLTFIHASSTAKKVIINPESLTDYCNKIHFCSGIIVLRPVNITTSEL